MKVVEEFFRELDHEWEPGQEGKITLLIIGSGALFLQTDYERGTKDSDVLETPEISKVSGVSGHCKKAHSFSTSDADLPSGSWLQEF